MRPRRSRLHLLPLLVAVLAELCSLALLAVSGWYLAACALAGLGLLATFSYPTPSGIVRLLALGRIGAGYGQNVLLHRAALADTTDERLRVYEEVATGSAAVDDRTIDRLLTEAQDEGERILRVSAPFVVTVAAVLTSAVVVSVTLPLAAVPLLLGAALMVALALSPTTVDDGHGRLRAEVLASMDAAPELESLGATSLLQARVHTQLEELSAAQRRREATQTRRLVLAALAAGLAFGAVILVGALASEPRLESVPLFVMIVCLCFGVLERTYAFGDIVPHLQRIRSSRIRRGGAQDRTPVPIAPVGIGGDGAVTIGEHADDAEPCAVRRFVVSPGAAAAIVGPSGSGKTTLLTAISSAVRDRAPATGSRSLSVAFVADDEFLFTGTVASNLRLGVEGGQRQDSSAEVELLGELGLSRDIRPDTRTGLSGRPLSRGEQRRIVIARAVLSDPDILLVDEPDLGLDAATYRGLLAFVRARLPEATVIFAAHSAPPGVDLRLDLGARARTPQRGHWRP